MSYIISKPAASGFAAALADFVIDSDNTVSFEVQYKGNAILSEEYVPDASNQVVVRKIGKFCNNALWGSWPSGNSTVQTNQFGTFTFLVDGQTQSSLVVFSRTAPARSLAETPFLSSAPESHETDFFRQKRDCFFSSLTKKFLRPYVRLKGTFPILQATANQTRSTACFVFCV